MPLHGAMLFVKDLSRMKQIEAMGLPLLRRPWGGTEAVDPEGNVFGLCAAN